jgi:chromosomal replication initiator protein
MRYAKGQAPSTGTAGAGYDMTEDKGETIIAGKALDERWQRVATRLKAEFGEDIYSSWFARVAPEGLRGGTVHLLVPTRFLKSWIGAHYQEHLLGLWQQEIKGITRLELSIRGRTQNAVRPAAGKDPRRMRPAAAPASAAHAATPAGTASVKSRPLAGEGEHTIGSPLDPRYNFETFVVGASNALAHAAANQVAALDSGQPGFNVLYLHSAVGLGKSHLLQATAWEARRQRQPERVIYLTAERFMYRFVAALKSQNALAFKDQLRGIDMLLIDDMQFLQGKSTQQEFCHTLNALMESGRQVVVAADRPPAELESLDDRMRSRLSAGLVVDIRPLGRSLRLAILKSKLETARRRLPELQIHDSILEYVADQVNGNGRELEGAFTRIVAHNQLTRADISIEMAERAIRDLVRTVEPKRVRIEHIQKVVAKHFNISRQDIVSSRRNRSIVRPRQISMYLAKTLTDRSFPEIGRRFGGRDHTTVLHAVRKIDTLMREDRSFAEEVELLKRLVEE